MKILHFISMGLFATLVAACSPTSALNPAKPEKLNQTIDQTVVSFVPDHAFARLNDTRRGHFLSGFKRDERLMEAARRHAELMGRTGKFGHEFGPGTKFKSRIFAVGFDNNAGENLGVGYKSIDEAIEGWLNSPGHRRILLKRNYTLGGIAYARNISGKNPRLNHFWMLIVGREG